MKNRSRILLAGLLVLILGLLVWATLRPHESEPSYRGRALSAWVRDLGHADFEPGGFAWEDWPLTKAPPNAEAAEAVCQIGSAGFPYLLNALTKKESPLKLKIARALP